MLTNTMNRVSSYVPDIPSPVDVFKSATRPVGDVVRKIRLSKKVEIANRYMNGKNYWNALTSQKKAKQFRADYKLDEFDDTHQKVKFIIPENVSQITPTFFAGVMYPSYIKLGEKCLQKYMWTITKNDEAPDRTRVLKEQIQFGLDYCRELKSSNVSAEEFFTEAVEDHEFKTISLIELLFDAIKPGIRGSKRYVNKSLRSFAQKMKQLQSKKQYQISVHVLTFLVVYAVTFGVSPKAGNYTSMCIGFLQTFINVLISNYCM